MKYIGVRLDWDEMEKLLNRKVPRLNGKMSENIRSIALKAGINKTLRGRQLHLYSVTDEEYAKLMSPKMRTWAGLKITSDLRPLLCVDEASLDQKIADTNRHYPRKMSREQYKIYKQHLHDSISECIQFLDNDGRRKSRVINDQRFNDLFCIG